MLRWLNSTLLLSACLIVAGCTPAQSPTDYNARDEACKKEDARPTSVNIITDSEGNQPGLLVQCSPKVLLAGPQAGKLTITVVNYLDEEVFLEVTGLGAPGWSLNMPGGGLSSGGGSFTIFPDNTQLLRRLHAATVLKNGERAVCGCCVAEIAGGIGEGAIKLGRGHGTVTVPITGFYRKTGLQFSELVDLPIELVNPVASATSQKDD